MMRCARITFVLPTFCLLLVLLPGCGGGGKEIGPTGEVEGKVTLDGEPFAVGSVALYDKTTGNTGGGELSPGGTFKFAVPVPVGTYQVSFPMPEAPPPDDPAVDAAANKNTELHQSYRNGETSGIVAEVKEGPNSFTFELKKTGP
ncbi:MAG: hypothetical protein R3C59_26365 [Planctomycetaceae bacterium]